MAALAQPLSYSRGVHAAARRIRRVRIVAGHLPVSVLALAPAQNRLILRAERVVVRRWHVTAAASTIRVNVSVLTVFRRKTVSASARRPARYSETSVNVPK